MGDVMRTISPTQRKSLEFVKRELQDGAEVPVIELQRRAKLKGIPTRSLTFSRRMLKVAVFKEAGRGRFVWKMVGGE